eukprot:m.60307 g.60307  ORF g.60307 m.60307 type:complete len:403 (+) comp15740_c0_seq10:2463-3671(+)
MRVIALEPELSADVESRPPKRLHRIWIQNAVLLFTHLVEKTDQRVEHVLAIHRKVPDFKLACGVSVVIQQLRCDLVVPTAAAVEVEEGGDTALPAHFTQLLRGLDVVQGPKVHLGSDGGCVYGAVVGVCWCSAVGVFADVAAEAVHDNLCIRGTLGRPAVTAACVLVTTQETVFSQGSDTRHEISLVGMHGKVLSKNLHRPDCVFHSQNRLLLLKIQHLSVRLASALDVLPVREFLLETLLDDLDLVRPDKQCFVAKHPQRPVGVVHHPRNVRHHRRRQPLSQCVHRHAQISFPEAKLLCPHLCVRLDGPALVAGRLLHQPRCHASRQILCHLVHERVESSTKSSQGHVSCASHVGTYGRHGSAPLWTPDKTAEWWCRGYCHGACVCGQAPWGDEFVLPVVL